MAFNVSTNSQAVFLDSRTRPGTVFLPSTFTIPGRVLTFKDQFGAFSTNSMTLTTNNANQTIDSLITSTINTQPLGWQSFIAGNNNRWYTVGGTLINTINASTVNTTVLRSVNISSANMFVSSLGIIDQTLRCTTQLYVQSSFLYYSFSNQSTILSGTRQSFGGLFTSLRRAFAPNQLSGLIVWVDAADTNTVALSGSTVTSIQDKSTIGALFNQGANRPTYSTFLNGLNGMNFQTVATGGIATSITTPYNSITQFSVFIVNRPTFASGTFGYAAGLFGIRNTTTTQISWHLQPGYTSFTAWNGVISINTPITVAQNENNLFCIVQGASSFVSAKNGTAIGSIPYTITARTGLPFNIGNSGSGSEAFIGFIGEIIFYSRAVTDLERQQVEGYLSWKWNLVSELPAAHPYKNFPP